MNDYNAHIRSRSSRSDDLLLSMHTKIFKVDEKGLLLSNGN